MGLGLTAIALATVAVVVWLVIKSRPEPFGAYIDFTKPPWSEAMAKAQSTIPTLRELFEAHCEYIMVKYPLETSQGENEHVWGSLTHLGETTFVATLDTPLKDGKALGEPPHEMPLSKLEDWQVELPDGTIRGGFTTRLDIELAKAQRRPIPPHIVAMEGRFVDA